MHICNVTASHVVWSVVLVSPDASASGESVRFDVDGVGSTRSTRAHRGTSIAQPARPRGRLPCRSSSTVGDGCGSMTRPICVLDARLKADARYTERACCVRGWAADTHKSRQRASWSGSGRSSDEHHRPGSGPIFRPPRGRGYHRSRPARRGESVPIPPERETRPPNERHTPDEVTADA